MDLAKKAMFKAEIDGLKSVLSGVSAMTGQLNQAAFPVMGPMVTVPTLPIAGSIIQNQNEVIRQLMGLIDRIVDEI